MNILLRVLLIVGLFVGIIFFLRWLVHRCFSRGKGKKAETIHKINCLIYDCGVEVGEITRRVWSYTPKSAKITGANLAGAAAVNVGLNLGKLLDPRKQVADLIKSELTLAYQELDRAIDNAHRHSSKEAINYIADCKNRLELIDSQPDHGSSISETISAIKAIRAEAKLIAEAESFDDQASTGDIGDNGKQAEESYYNILGVTREATAEEIKQAFRVLAQIYHPDKYSTLNENKRQQMENEFKTINEAYSTLSDPNQRAQYDQSL